MFNDILVPFVKSSSKVSLKRGVREDCQLKTIPNWALLISTYNIKVVSCSNVLNAQEDLFWYLSANLWSLAMLMKSKRLNFFTSVKKNFKVVSPKGSQKKRLYLYSLAQDSSRFLCQNLLLGFYLVYMPIK